MPFFGKQQSISYEEKKKEEKNRTKKTVKKPIKKTKPTIVVSATVLQLAKRFAEFVLSLPDNKKQCKPQYKKWSEQLQEFVDLSNYSFIQIRIVFEWYASHHQELWKIESPQSFIKHYESLLKHYERSINPYTPQQLKQIMSWLLRLRWKCSNKELEIVVGRSLWMINQLLDKCNSDDLKAGQYILFFKVISNNIGNPFDFIQFYFERWFWEHDNTENIKIAEITKKRILTMLNVWLIEYGINNDEVLEQFILIFDCLEEISFDSVMSD
jgi:hypothetical protein